MLGQTGMQSIDGDTLNDFALVAVEAVEGDYGWAVEILSLLAMVVVINFCLGWLLKKLHQRYVRQHNLWKDAFVVALLKPLSSFVWLIALVQLLNGLWAKFSGVELFPSHHSVLKIGLIISASWFFFRWKRGIVSKLMEKSRRKDFPIDHGKIDAINKVVTLLLYMMTILLLIEQLGGSMNTLIAFGGVSGLAVAFASQQIIANFFGGILIYFTKPFVIGDWIKIPEKDLEGIVEEIGWYTTEVKSLEKLPIYVPNSILTNIIVMNPSRMEQRQFKEIVGVRFEDMPKVEKLVQLLKKRIEEHDKLDLDFPPQVYLHAFNTYSVDILITAYTTAIQKDAFAQFNSEILTMIHKSVMDVKADFAYPTSVVELSKEIVLKN
ncbi:MAG: mechanosensitive ion channel family protein [Parachlamydiaceae bacterium]